MDDSDDSPWADPLPDYEEGELRPDRDEERYSALMARLRAIEDAIKAKPSNRMTIGDGISLGIGMFVVLPVLIVICLILLSTFGIGLHGLLR
jgi:hypothetical protein